MPRRNSLKTYIENGYYHIYNRGVEKRVIFQDEQDYKVFLSYLKFSLSPLPDKKERIITFILQGLPFKGVAKLPKSFYGEIELLAYCLMPNHFHLLTKQIKNRALESFMISLMTRYSMYFNKKYKRVGSLFQGPYKAVLVLEDPYLLHLSRYIHLNPAEYTNDLTNAYSSYSEYLRLRNTEWIKTDFILKFFETLASTDLVKVNSYQKFVENFTKDSFEVLGNLTLEDRDIDL